jgi:hypothetical protein
MPSPSCLCEGGLLRPVLLQVPDDSRMYASSLELLRQSAAFLSMEMDEIPVERYIEGIGNGFGGREVD